MKKQYKKAIDRKKKLKGLIQEIKAIQETKTHMDDPWKTRWNDKKRCTKLRDSKLRDENEKHEVLAEGPWEY